MRGRPPLTILAYIALVAVLLVYFLAVDGADYRVLFGCVVLGVSAAGLYLRSRIAWILTIAFHVANFVHTVAQGTTWLIAATLVVLAALLVAPPSVRWFVSAPKREPKPVSRARRAVRIALVVAAAFVLLPLVLAPLLPGPVSGDVDLVHSDRPGLRVLFIGTTLTSDHSMPRTVRRLSESDRGAPPIFAVRYAERGSKLDEALDDERLTELLDGERWDFVVLQEHSQRLSRPADRAARAVPAALALNRMAARAGARTVLFGNPGYEDGDRDEVPADTYEAMQARLGEAQREVAATLSALPAPVDAAWAQARLAGVDLWGRDGIRPSEAGSYLIACVLYATLTDRDPTAAGYDAGLDPGEARRLRRIAEEARR